MDVLVIVPAIIATALDPLLLVTAAGLAYVLRDKGITAAGAAGLAIAVGLEALVAVLAAAERDAYRFGQLLLPRIIAAVTVILAARAAWRALKRDAAERTEPG